MRAAASDVVPLGPRPGPAVGTDEALRAARDGDEAAGGPGTAPGRSGTAPGRAEDPARSHRRTTPAADAPDTAGGEAERRAGVRGPTDPEPGRTAQRPAPRGQEQGARR